VNKILLSIKNLKVSVEKKIILDDISLDIFQGQIHAIMGPNGSGKSTLANTLMGHPKYKIESGKIIFAGEDVSEFSADKRARLGLFLAMQNPYEIEGVVFKDFLRQSYNAIYKGTDKELDLKGFKKLLTEKMELLKIKPEFVERFLNVGFSGGEKKRAEVLQLAVLQPKLAILDEIDSGLDVDALKIVCDGLNQIKTDSKEISFLIITHYPRILHYLNPDFVHVMQHGNIVKSGDIKVAQEIEKNGYK
jgi:Fe-S cluster assembly ATP-binding protein